MGFWGQHNSVRFEAILALKLAVASMSTHWEPFLEPDPVEGQDAPPENPPPPTPTTALEGWVKLGARVLANYRRAVEQERNVELSKVFERKYGLSD